MCLTNSKAEALYSAIKAKLLSNPSIERVDDIIHVTHSPEDKDCGSIIDWTSATCTVIGYFCRQQNNNGEEEWGVGSKTIDVEIAYDKKSDSFTIEITYMSEVGSYH
jgi:hypothetical protein